MKKDNYLSEYASVIEFLDRLGVYDIRNIAREVGVPSPTTEKKGDLIRAIVEVESGQKAPEGKRTNKGAPTKGGKISEGLLSEIRKMISDVKESQRYPSEPPEENSIDFRDSCPGKQEFGYRDEVYCGILEIHPQGYGFLRGENCEPGRRDAFVAATLIKQYRLRNGDFLSGYVKQNRESGSPALTEIATVNGAEPQENAVRKNFDDLTPCYPDRRIELGNCGKLSLRCIDLMCPLGTGQRGLIVSPPKAGKTTLLKDIAGEISDRYPGIHLIVLLIDERPEEVTDIRKHLPQAEIVFSTFDESSEHHISVSELILDRAKRLAEQGRDVVLLLDSITKLARAYNNMIVSSGKVLSGGLDAAALAEPKKFFGSARNFENGGSLTILATALVDTGSRMDDVIYEEFKGTGNMEIHLSRELAERRVFPAIDVYRSGTRKEELLLSERELNCSYAVRRMLSKENATESLFEMMKKTKDNDEFIEKTDEWLKIYKNNRGK